ncbi:MAG: methionine adenosyltransferase domain-containing protein, partial [Treponema sp.]|nr:methionine adenosyltransferase domain-containing protein [Treponema sp.]
SQYIFDNYIKNNNDLVIDVNPCGEWRTGGPVSDCGVTGRKIVVDAYGGYCNVGGGAFSGKDLTKVDRSAAYMCRYLAKNIVATGICNTAKVELSYMIGIPEPSAINIELDINNDKSDKIIEWIKSHIDLTPKGIIERFEGFYPRYYNTAKNGHYGYNVDGNKELETLYPWEKIDIAKPLQEIIK